jgi:LysR family cys regulon transcriptional activator
VSKAIIELEQELGIDIFARHGKRLKRITEPGQHVLKSIEVIMREIGNLKKIGDQYSEQNNGTLSIATTHTQARYVLPLPVAKLRELYPQVNISLHQGSPDQVAKMHLEDIAKEPLITYHPSFTGRTKIDIAFASKNLHPRIALEAIDSDVIKTYVRLGLGVGIVAEMAMKDDPVGDLIARPLGDLLGKNVARVAFKRGAYLRNFVYQFAELLSDRLTAALVAKAMTGHVNDYEI